MAVCYNNLWKLLIDKNMNKTGLKEAAGISFNVMARMGKNETISFESIEKICTALNCDVGDIISIAQNTETEVKDFKTIVFEFNNQKKVITKTKGRYVESEFEEDLPEITLFGDNIDENILNNLANQRVEEKKNKVEAGQLDKFFGSQWNNRK